MKKNIRSAKLLPLESRPGRYLQDIFWYCQKIVKVYYQTHRLQDKTAHLQLSWSPTAL